MDTAITGWLESKKVVLENIVVNAADEFLQNCKIQNRQFDCKQTSAELHHLANGKDLCYDRPTIGFTYSLWYHAKRVNTLLNYYLHLVINAPKDRPIEIFDLGAGTGAVQWAVGLAYAALVDLKIPVPNISVINIDSSPFMLQYNQHFLWRHFLSKFPAASNIQTTYTVNSWVNAEIKSTSTVWITASYLFDHSENAREVADEFEKLIKNFEPAKLLLISARKKSDFVNAVATRLAKLGYTSQTNTSGNLTSTFSGLLGQVTQYRNRLQQTNDFGFSGNPSWDMDSLYGKVLTKVQQGFLPLDTNGINLYVYPERNRSKIRLTDDQISASLHTGRPTIIVGPAG